MMEKSKENADVSGLFGAPTFLEFKKGDAFDYSFKTTCRNE